MRGLLIGVMRLVDDLRRAIGCGGGSFVVGSRGRGDGR